MTSIGLYAPAALIRHKYLQINVDFEELFCFIIIYNRIFKNNLAKYTSHIELKKLSIIQLGMFFYKNKKAAQLENLT